MQSFFSQLTMETSYMGSFAGLVRVPKDIPSSYGTVDLYQGQLCFVAESSLFDGLHAIRYDGDEFVCRFQVIPGGALISWEHYKEDGVKIKKEDYEHLGAVVGVYGNFRDPALWMYTN